MAHSKKKKYQTEYSELTQYYLNKKGEHYTGKRFIENAIRQFIEFIIKPFLITNTFSRDIIFCKKIREESLEETNANKFCISVKTIMLDFPNELTEIFRIFKLQDWENILLEKLKLTYVGEADKKHEINCRFIESIEKYILNYNGPKKNKQSVEKNDLKHESSKRMKLKESDSVYNQGRNADENKEENVKPDLRNMREMTNDDLGLHSIEDDRLNETQIATIEDYNEEVEAEKKVLNSLNNSLNEDIFISIQTFFSAAKSSLFSQY